jgi:hypothetical protein
MAVPSRAPRNSSRPADAALRICAAVDAERVAGDEETIAKRTL